MSSKSFRRPPKRNATAEQHRREAVYDGRVDDWIKRREAEIAARKKRPPNAKKKRKPRKARKPRVRKAKRQPSHDIGLMNAHLSAIVRQG